MADYRGPLTVGDLRPSDDLMHPVSSDASHNESMFFNFFDSEKSIGGFVRIGNRPNEKHSEMTFCLFLPDGSLLMQWAKPSLEGNAGFAAGGLEFSVEDPGRHLRVIYRGTTKRIADPYRMREPGPAMRSSPDVQVNLDLDVLGVGPMIGDRTGDRADSVIFLDGVGHYQQPIEARGKISVDGWQKDLLMSGVRDHSWGKRVWSSIFKDRSIWISYGESLTFIVCKTWLDADGSPDEMGCIVEYGEVTPFESIDISSHFREDSYYHDALRLELGDAAGRKFVVDGRVIAYVPLRHRHPERPTVYLGQAMTDFTFDGKRTLGLSEYFDAEFGTDALIAVSRRDGSVHE